VPDARGPTRVDGGAAAGGVSRAQTSSAFTRFTYAAGSSGRPPSASTA
jgi:hypothetical protein